MREFDDATLELQLRGVLREHLSPLPLDLTAEALERRRLVRDRARRRRRTILGLGLAAALVLPAGWLIAGGWRQPPDRTAVVVVAPTAPPDTAPAPTHAAPAPTPTDEAGPDGLVVYPVWRRLQLGEGTCTEGASWESCTEFHWWISKADGTGAQQFVIDDPALWFPVSWSPAGDALLAQDLDGSRLALIDASGHVQRQYDLGPCPVEGFCAMNAGSASMSPDATRLAFDWGGDSFAKSKYTSGLATLDLKTGTVTEVAGTRSVNRDGPCWKSSKCEGQADTPRWSPDGTRLLFGRESMSSEPGSRWTSAAIFIVGVDGSDLRRVTPQGMYATDASWSPDGSTIAFADVTMVRDKANDGVVQAGQDIYTIRTDGTDLRRLTTDGAPRAPRWTPDGRLFFFRGDANWIMDADGGAQTELGFDLGTLTDAGCTSCLYPGPEVSVSTQQALWQPLP